MNLTLKRPVSRDEVNDMVRHAALNGELVNQIHYRDRP